jgi:glycosyltransferase involved in cell wall biosynthesis
MRIAHLCTFWPLSTGLSHYVDALIQGMRASRPDRHTILAEIGSDAAKTEAYDCIPCYRREDDYVEDIVNTAQKEQVELLVVQYANDLFGDDNRLSRLLGRLRSFGIKTVVNTHSVYPPNWRTAFKPGRTAGDFDRAMGEQASFITVHSPRMKDDLISHGLSSDRIAVIPHGTPIMPILDMAECRAKLGLPGDAKIVLFFGFIWPGKGIDFLLNVFRDVHRQVPEAFLLVGGHTRRRLWGSYVDYLKLRARLMGFASHSRFWGGYVAEEKVAEVYSAADVVAMPYSRSTARPAAWFIRPPPWESSCCVPASQSLMRWKPASTRADRSPDDHARLWTRAMVRLLRDEEWGASSSEDTSIRRGHQLGQRGQDALGAATRA